MINIREEIKRKQRERDRIERKRKKIDKKK